MSSSLSWANLIKSPRGFVPQVLWPLKLSRSVYGKELYWLHLWEVTSILAGSSLSEQHCSVSSLSEQHWRGRRTTAKPKTALDWYGASSHVHRQEPSKAKPSNTPSLLARHSPGSQCASSWGELHDWAATVRRPSKIQGPNQGICLEDHHLILKRASRCRSLECRAQNLSCGIASNLCLASAHEVSGVTEKSSTEVSIPRNRRNLQLYARRKASMTPLTRNNPFHCCWRWWTHARIRWARKLHTSQTTLNPDVHREDRRGALGPTKRLRVEGRPLRERTQRRFARLAILGQFGAERVVGVDHRLRERAERAAAAGLAATAPVARAALLGRVRGSEGSAVVLVLRVLPGRAESVSDATSSVKQGWHAPQQRRLAWSSSC